MRWRRCSVPRWTAGARRVVVTVDRSGLNDTRPVVRALYAAIDRVLAPIVADEERRQSARTIRPTNALRARDQVGCAH